MDALHPTLSVIIADDHPLYRIGLKQWLTTYEHIQIIGEAQNGEELCTFVQELSPHVVVTDIAMPHMNGIDATKWIKATYPKTGVVALSMSEDPNLIREMFRAGAGAYLLKNEDVATVSAAICAVSRGAYFVSTIISRYLVEIVAPMQNSCLLTRREVEILQLLFEELTSREIGEMLHLSERTIEDHRKHIQQKVGAKNVVGLIKYALQRNLVRLKQNK